MKTPKDKQIAFLFVSHPVKDPAWRWQARVTFPPGATAETELPVEIEDGAGEPVAAAVFEFAGRRLEVANGRATLTYADFIAGRSVSALWLYRDGIPPIPGGLTFG